ncbi:Hypothetical protein CINCED_3A006598 [Cinara cedri]|uniref:DUF4485 domain-containing protein n=1 Tax=Cinara cedri TaxID=506608 RepID=A0A5E4N1N3_9HEMI|nr:Hypothetical protein CINCED_3A006598 [Cinara cedri]
MMATGLDEKVEEDFVFFLDHFQESFDSLKSERDKEICQKWLDKLAIEKYKDTNEKQIRNIYLSQLIISMNERKLSAPFNESPKSAKLSLDGVFKHVTTKPTLEVEHEQETSKNQKNWHNFVRNRELEVIDMNHLSIDGSTYIACKTLAEDSGIFAYVAVTMGGKTDQGWVNTCGQPIPAPVVQPLDLQVESPDSQNNKSEHDDKLYKITVEVKAILSKRKSVEARVLTQQFFQRVYNSIEQEMLSEQDPNSTACHDPYVKKLLENLINDSKACDKFNPVLFKRIKMLSLLKKRVKHILNDIENRNKNLANIEVASSSPILTLTNPASTCSNSMTEMMWQGALMEKPTSKMAEELAKTYPVCLVKMLLALLARERRKIISRLQEKQENLIVAMKRDLQNEIQQGILNYKVTVVG